ncbi:MAG TPA: hypothetical protein VKI17_12330 [Gemmataceae bacterium]|nr:hypothetical protein [Gemmataceae bacterium]
MLGSNRNHAAGGGLNVLAMRPNTLVVELIAGKRAAYIHIEQAVEFRDPEAVHLIRRVWTEVSVEAISGTLKFEDLKFEE